MRGKGGPGCMINPKMFGELSPAPELSAPDRHNSQTFVETVGLLLLNQISNYNYSCALRMNSRNSKNVFPQAFVEAFHKRLWD